MTPDDPQNVTQTKASSPAARPARRKRRWLRLGIVAAVLAVLAAIIFIAPTYIARYIVADQLAEMGIETEGVETIDIDVWNHEVWLGPVRFRNPQMEAGFGEVQRIGVRVSLTRLFKTHVLIERVIIEGIHIDVVQEADGTIRINGVSPAELAKPEETETSEPEDDSSSWLAGIDSFELRDSTASFTNAANGRLQAEIDSLILQEFYGWSPEDPGMFTAAGSLNRIPFSWEGKAWPFADTIRASFDGRIREVELAKIEEFTGPLGLDRQEGVINPTMHYEMTWTPEGQLTTEVTGQVDMKSIDIMPPDSIRIQIDSGTVDIDYRLVLDENTNIKATGQTSLAVNAADIKMPDGLSVQLPQARLNVTGLDADVPIEGQLRAAATASLEITNPMLVVPPPSGDTDGSSSQPSGEPLELTAQGISTELTQFAYEQSADASAISLRGGIDLTLLAIAAKVPVDDVIANTTGQTFTLKAPSVDITLNDQGTEVKANGNAVFESLGIEMPKSAAAPALDAQVRRFAVDLQQLALDQRPDDTSLQVALSSEIDDVAGNLDQGEIGKISLSKLSLKAGTINGNIGQGLDIAAAEVLLTSPNVDITDRMLTAFGSDSTSENVDTQTTDEAAVKVKIGRFAVQDQGELVYVDTSVEPRVRVQTAIELLEAEHIDTGDVQQPTNVKLDAIVNEFTKVQLVGWVTPFLQPPTFEFAGRIGDLALPSLSPYAAQAVGMNLQQGSLTAKADASAKEDGNLRGRIDLDVNNLAFTPLSKEDAERLSAQIGLPIDTIIGLLQDSDGEIDLKIPISGNIEDPSFDFTDAIAKALTGAVTAAITAPFEILFAPVQMVADAARGAPVAFKPVTFSPGSREIDAQSRVFLKALVDMLNKRPDLRLQVCGHATAQDFQSYKATTPARNKAPAPPSDQAQANPVAAQKAEAEAARPQLQALAEARGRTVRRFIVQENDIKPERIGECRAEVDVTDQGPPRVEISF